MRHRATSTWAALVTLLLASAANAGERSVSVRDLTVVQDGRGAARLLFRINALDLDENTLIRRALLSVPFAAPPQERALVLRLYPVSRSWDATASWSAPWATAGGDFDYELYSEARVELRSGTGVAVFDVTVLLKEILEEGVFADGFLLTDVTGGARGVRSQDLSALQVEAASLHVSTRTVVNRPRVGVGRVQ